MVGVMALRLLRMWGMMGLGLRVEVWKGVRAFWVFEAQWRLRIWGSCIFYGGGARGGRWEDNLSFRGLVRSLGFPLNPRP